MNRQPYRTCIRNGNFMSKDCTIFEFSFLRFNSQMFPADLCVETLLKHQYRNHSNHTHSWTIVVSSGVIQVLYILFKLSFMCVKFKVKRWWVPPLPVKLQGVMVEICPSEMKQPFKTLTSCCQSPLCLQTWLCFSKMLSSAAVISLV